MSESSDPQWDLLPYEPERFFGLEGEFDLRDLKRAYNKLIRRFKPERCPDEFQKIRSAFEELNDAIRYDVLNRSLPVVASKLLDALKASPNDDEAAPNTEPSTHRPWSTGPTPSATNGPTPIKETFVQRLQHTSPNELYSELKSKSIKQVADYIALALISDTNGQRLPDESFYDWLLAGLSEFGRDRGMIELLRVQLRNETDYDLVIRMLVRTAETVPANRFQYITVRAWERVIRNVPFAEVRASLVKCGELLARGGDQSQTLFYLCMLKLVMWNADGELVAEMYDIINENFFELESFDAEEYETIATLYQYRQMRNEFVEGGASCQQIDQAIHDWCFLSETQSDISVLNCQYFINSNGQHLLEEFSVQDRDYFALLQLWNRIVSDTMERLGEPETQDREQVAQDCYNFMVRVRRRQQRTQRHFIGLTLYLIAFLVSLLALIVGGVMLVQMALAIGEQDYWPAIGEFFGSIGVFTAGLLAAVLAIYVGGSYDKMRYHQFRHEALKLLSVAPFELKHVTKIIAEQEDAKFGDDETILFAEYFAEAMSNDPAMEIYSLAQLCLSAAAAEPLVLATIVE